MKITNICLAIIFGSLTMCSCIFIREHVPVNLDLSREAFIRELIINSETEVTKHFNDYRPDSYHINKLNLIEGISELSDSTTRDVKAVFILGPSGPLWQYNVSTILDSNSLNDSINVNHLVFPHARITLKTTRKLSRIDYNNIMEQILSNPLLQDTTFINIDSSFESDFTLSFVVSRFDKLNRVQVIPNSLDDQNTESMELIYKNINTLTSDDKARVTYK